MTKKFSHNHGQPRNLQHNTLIIKEKFNTIPSHTHKRKTKLKPSIPHRFLNDSTLAKFL